MITKAFLAGIVVALCGPAALTSAQAAELRGIALSSGADSAQVMLDLSETAAPKLFTLEHPDRVVIDLPHTHRAPSVRAPVGSGVVSSMRFGVQPHGMLRVVIELQSALPAHTLWASTSAGPQLLVNLGQPPVAATAQASPRSVRAQHAPGDGERDVIVAVDAGHGGVDPGAIGHGGTREKDVTLAIARALARRIDAEPGMHAVLTRNRDEFIELHERIARAHAAHADIFVSVHADSIVDRAVTGASVYVLSAHGASSEAAKVLADRENAADLMGGVLADQGALRPVLLDAAQSEMIGLSATAAERVVNALGSVGAIRKAQVQQAGFVVLKSPEFPSMLVETAYISNPAEERRLRSAEQQSRLAEAIAGGVRSYFIQNPPDGSRFKEESRVASAAETTTTVAAH